MIYFYYYEIPHPESSFVRFKFHRPDGLPKSLIPLHLKIKMNEVETRFSYMIADAFEGTILKKEMQNLLCNYPSVYFEY